MNKYITIYKDTNENPVQYNAILVMAESAEEAKGKVLPLLEDGCELLELYSFSLVPRVM